MKHNEKYYIIDSKYYNYGYTNNPNDLPQSSSISKQIGYNHYLREILNQKNNEKDKQTGIEDEKVRSIFLLPYSKKENEDVIKFVGWAQKKTETNNNDKIAVYLVDLKTLVDAYLGIIKLSYDFDNWG